MEASKQPPNNTTTGVPQSGIEESNETTIIIHGDPNNNMDVAEQKFRREADQYVPLANIKRIMHKILPPNARIADDAKETVQECVSEFISHVTSVANDKCHKECRSTITSEDIISAMGTIGLDNYVQPLTLYLNKMRNKNEVVSPRASFAQPKPPATQPLPVWSFGPAIPWYSSSVDRDNINVPSSPMNLDYYLRNVGANGGSSSNN